jgi:uncharacterized integral membrane protein
MHEHIDPDAGDAAAGWDRPGRVSPALIVFAALTLLLIIFIAENGHDVRVRLIVPRVTMPVWAAILICVALGVVLDRLFLVWWRRRKTA